MNTKAKQRKAKLGTKNPNWGNGKSRERGYETVPAPWKGKGGRREYVHRIKTGARKGEAVHHKDKQRSHNTNSNLQRTTNHPGRKGGEHTTNHTLAQRFGLTNK